MIYFLVARLFTFLFAVDGLKNPFFAWSERIGTGRILLGVCILWYSLPYLALKLPSQSQRTWKYMLQF